MSPRSATANEQIRDARRAAILDAARRTFARKGLAGTRISDITAEAGISQGLLYHYFPNKEALFTTLVEDGLRATRALTAAAASTNGSAWHRLQVLCEEMLSGVLDHPDYPLVTIQAFTSDAVPHEARAAVELYGGESFRDILSVIRQGQVDGDVVPGDPVQLALTFTSCIQGVALSRLQVGPRGGPLTTTETVLRLLRADARPG
jgi:AcrR family transcriptional regulator